MMLFQPHPNRRDADEDGFPCLPEISEKQLPLVVGTLAEHLMCREVPMSTVAEYSESDWDKACWDVCREEWCGLITEAIASQVLCRMLREQVQWAESQAAEELAEARAWEEAEMMETGADRCPERE